MCRSSRGVDSLRLTMAVSNLLENALNACRQLPKGQRRYILFNAVFTGQLMLEVANPYAGNIRWGSRHTPLAENEGHGIGTESVLAFVKEVNAQIFYEAQDQVFRVRLLF